MLLPFALSDRRPAHWCIEAGEGGKTNLQALLENQMGLSTSVYSRLPIVQEFALEEPIFQAQLLVVDEFVSPQEFQAGSILVQGLQVVMLVWKRVEFEQTLEAVSKGPNISPPTSSARPFLNKRTP